MRKKSEESQIDLELLNGSTISANKLRKLSERQRTRIAELRGCYPDKILEVQSLVGITTGLEFLRAGFHIILSQGRLNLLILNRGKKCCIEVKQIKSSGELELAEADRASLLLEGNNRISVISLDRFCVKESYQDIKVGSVFYDRFNNEFTVEALYSFDGGNTTTIQTITSIVQRSLITAKELLDARIYCKDQHSYYKRINSTAIGKEIRLKVAENAFFKEVAVSCSGYSISLRANIKATGEWEAPTVTYSSIALRTSLDHFKSLSPFLTWATGYLGLSLIGLVRDNKEDQITIGGVTFVPE